MTQTSTQQMRRWFGPVILSYGFRPFFFLGAVWAGLAMVIWIGMLAGLFTLPSAFDPVSWHAHEFLFGYLSAIIAGFLLTAVPNWTGRLPVVGWQLGGLVAIWVLGRIAMAGSALIPAPIVITVDLAFPIVLGGLILREIVVGRNWKNLIVVALLAGFALGNLLYHLEALRGGIPAQGIGLRLGLAVGVMMISVIGGRVVPSFTRNWLVKAGSEARPAAPMQRFDKVVLLGTLTGLLLWVILPEHWVTGFALVLIAVAQMTRLLRWQSIRTGAEPLVWVLHAGYAFIPLGALMLALGILVPDQFGTVAMQHIWMAGAIGLMTLAVMTRATLGHTGQALHAGAGTTALFIALIASVVARLSAGIWPESAMPLYYLSALLWIGTFAGFAVLYGPLLLRAKPSGT